jgi:hypothetical protein
VVFALFDANGDGLLDQSEFMDVMREKATHGLDKVTENCCCRASAVGLIECGMVVPSEARVQFEGQTEWVEVCTHWKMMFSCYVQACGQDAVCTVFLVANTCVHSLFPTISRTVLVQPIQTASTIARTTPRAM